MQYSVLWTTDNSHRLIPMRATCPWGAVPEWTNQRMDRFDLGRYILGKIFHALNSYALVRWFLSLMYAVGHTRDVSLLFFPFTVVLTKSFFFLSPTVPHVHSHRWSNLNILQTTISFIGGVKHYLLNTYYPQWNFCHMTWKFIHLTYQFIILIWEINFNCIKR